MKDESSIDPDILAELIRRSKKVRDAIASAKQDYDADMEQAQKQSKLTPALRIADHLHRRECSLNHTDQCSYYYENWSDIVKHRRTKNQYLDRAGRLLDLLDGDEFLAEDVINIIFGQDDEDEDDE